MIVQNLYHANLKIDAVGTVTLESAWQLARNEPAAELEALLDEARAWAGKIGDPFRVPQADGSFDLSDTVRVAGIEIRPSGLSGCRVVYSGSEFAAEGGGSAVPAAMGSVSNIYDPDGTHRRKCRFRAPTTLSAALIPVPGRVLDWEGGAFVCESCAVTSSELAVEFEVTARETALAELGLPVSGFDDDGFETKQTVWFVAAAGYGTFTALHPVGGAEAWAGERFLLVSLESRPVGRIGYEVTLHARKAETRLLSQVRTEEFSGIARSGAVMREIVWLARWRVVAEELPEFFLLTGTVPADWAEPGCIITKVTPKRLSDMEYEVTVEAQHNGNPGLYVRYTTEDRSGLDTRTDVAVDLVEFHVTAEMAGYRKLPDGQYLPIVNWNAPRSCPFLAEERLSEMMIEKIVRCLVITESIYVSGGVAAQVENLTAWTDIRVVIGTVAGISGSYLKIAQRCKETYDDSGRLYTRITRSYQKSPRGWNWSTNFWNYN